MALFNPTFVLGVIVLLYLLTFVVFAVIRIVTGLSIQRVGYFSLRRLAFVPRDGLKIEIRGVGLNIHRPTFAQPTWLSIVISELTVTVDNSEVDGSKTVDETAGGDAAVETPPLPDSHGPASGTENANASSSSSQSRPPSARRETPQAARSETWRKLMKLKERIKRLHRNVNWLRMVDVVATNSTVSVVGVGNVQVGSFTIAVDTRRTMVNRDRYLFGARNEKPKQKRQAEWIITLRSVLFTAEGKESMEIVDNATLNIHGFLYEALDGLRDAAVALKLGRVHLPYDDLMLCAKRYRKRITRPVAKQGTAAAKDGVPVVMLAAVAGKPAAEAVKAASSSSNSSSTAGGDAADLMQTVSDSKEFISSILRGIKEVQFAVSFLGLSKRVETARAAGAPVLRMNMSMKEVGIDLHRLDPKSAAHRMYFPSKDIAHEALAAALSVSVGVDDGRGEPQRLLYIPMATTTVKTTLPSKTVALTGHISPEERNANILFANSVVTSPSVDLDLRHLPLLVAMFRSKPKPPRAKPQQRHLLISGLLPKANIKFSMHEPVVRITLPPVHATADPDDFDLIISSISSISMDIESFHHAEEQLHYSLASTMRLQTHCLFYQTFDGSRFDLLQTESFDLKVQLSASPDVHVVASGNLQTFAVKMVRPEITDGLRQIVMQLHPTVEPDKRSRTWEPKSQPDFLRAMPEWLLHFQLQASEFSIEVAGVDKDISNDSKGMALQLESWTAEYWAHRLDTLHRRPAARRRALSRSMMLMPDTELLTSSPTPPKKKNHRDGDGRRIAIHGRGLEAFIIESSEKWETDPFVHVPRFEVAFSTQSDSQGAVFHIHSHVRTIHLLYSLERHYCVGVATTVLRKAFMRTARDAAAQKEQHRPDIKAEADPTDGADTAHPVEELDADATGETDAMDVAHRARPSSSSSTSASSSCSSLGTDGTDEPPESAPRELVAIDIKAGLVQIKADMPTEPPMMLQIFGLETGRHRWSPPFFYSKLIRLLAEAPRMPKVWSRVLSVKNGRMDCREARRKLSGSGSTAECMFDVTADVMRLAVPHELIVHKISDNVVNVAKCIQQLHHRFKTGTNEYILNKGPEQPKNVPRISLRCGNFMLELEDGAFEWKLGMIYRAGRVEQMQRLAREEAFRVKAKKIQEEEARREPSKYRARSTGPRGRDSSGRALSGTRSRSADGRPRAHGLGRTPRYDPEGSSLGMTGNAHITIAEARHKLDLHNSRGWKQRIDRHYEMARNGIKDIRGLFWGPDRFEDDNDGHENILGIPDRPALMSTMIGDLHLIIDRPSFPMRELPDFLHKVGKGMPRDMQFTLLVPMNLQIRMGEARATLRDYPLPLLHVPGVTAQQPYRLHALTLMTDFVIAEEFQGPESTRHVKVEIVPARGGAGSFAIDVRRTISPVKSYSDVTVDINTALPTRFTWGPSYQPAIQDMMMVFESLTKPQLDPSERVGFWDKIRLNFHSRVRVAWKADGNVHLALKGTRDPYQVTGNGTGLLMCWRNEVRWNVHVDDDPKEFMTVESGEYILAVPDYSHHAREAARQSADSDSLASSEDSLRSGAAFKKVVMKLSGKVRWVAGLVFERAIEQGQRNFAFVPHYGVVLRAPQYARATAGGQPYDAFRGFRSQHIHMSLAVLAPVDRDWTAASREPSRSYNTVHLTPRFFTHFFAWWSLFGGPLSLPIRQGSLWPGREKGSKKFGRHVATIKYNLLLAPLFLSHIYKHGDMGHADGAGGAEADGGGGGGGGGGAGGGGADGSGASSATGVKVRFDSFMLDLHQRREEFNTRDKGRKTQSRTTGMKIHAGQLDLAGADVRAVSAAIRAATTAAGLQYMQHTLQQHEDVAVDVSRFTIPDEDLSWIDMDDFVELDWILPTEPNPDTKILPLAYAPRFTYVRQTDIDGVISGDPDRTSPFGQEPTHLCIMTPDADPRTVQRQLVGERLGQLDGHIEELVRAIDEAGARMGDEGADVAAIEGEIADLSRQANVLQQKRLFLSKMVPEAGETGETGEMDAAEAADAGPEDGSRFSNRFVIHNMKFKWNNMLRNIVLRYFHQVSQRRGFVYYLSRPAVKFILDIVEEQAKLKAAAAAAAAAAATAGGGATTTTTAAVADATVAGPEGVQSAAATPASTASRTSRSSDGGAGSGMGNGGGDMAAAAGHAVGDIEDRIRKILQDGRQFVSTEEGGRPRRDSRGSRGSRIGNEQRPETAYSTAMEDLAGGIAEEFAAQNTYHLRLVAPQIQMQSDKNRKHVVLVAAKAMELKVVEVLDKARLSDDVSGLVQRRILVAMDSTQFFVTQRQWFLARAPSAHWGSSYGTRRGSSWPPWVPLEAVADFEGDPLGFRRVVQKTSAMLRYDKYNTLRLKYNEGVGEGMGEGMGEGVGEGLGGEGFGDNTGAADDDDGGGSAAAATTAATTTADGRERRMDNLWVEFPQVRVLCDSSQYFAMYVIVLDLLMWSEPLEKTRSERLEKIMLASDFSDLRGAPEMVVRLQERVRQLEAIKTHFQIHSKYLDRRGWEERLVLERDLAACEDELFFLMKAITRSQGEGGGGSGGGGGVTTGPLLKWCISAREIVWHLLRRGQAPLVELQLKDVEYDRTDNADGSHINLIQVGRILGLNLLPDAMYPEMVAPYYGDGRGPRALAGEPMVRVYWYMLEAVAGITVMDHFEVTLFPMRIQLEHEVGKKLFAYIFPDSAEAGTDSTGGDVSGKAAKGAKASKTSKAGKATGKDTKDTKDTNAPSDVDSTDPQSNDDDDGDDDDDGPDARRGADPAGLLASPELELRLHPTLTSNQPTAAASGRAAALKPASVHSADSSHPFRFFARGPTLAKRPSHESLHSLQSLQSLQSSLPSIRLGVGRSSTGFSSLNAETAAAAAAAGPGPAHPPVSRFGRRRRRTSDGQRASTAGSAATTPTTTTTTTAAAAARPSDDLTKMIARASNYMTFAHVKMPSVVLCLSYKGRGEHNIEDVHDFVFRLPTIEYRNKTWSNLDLALELKSRVIKALISHTGAIINNKFSKHRPNTAQQSKLRELATSSVLLATPALFERPADRPGSRASSVASGHGRLVLDTAGPSPSSSSSSRPSPAFLTMTPATPQSPQDNHGATPVADFLRPATASRPNSHRPFSRIGGVRDRFTALASRVKDRDSTAPDSTALRRVSTSVDSPDHDHHHGHHPDPGTDADTDTDADADADAGAGAVAGAESLGRPLKKIARGQRTKTT